MEKHLSLESPKQTTKKSWLKPAILSGIALAAGMSVKTALAEELETKDTQCEPKAANLCIKAPDGTVDKQCAATFGHVNNPFKHETGEDLNINNLWHLESNDTLASILENPNIKLDICGIKNLLPIFVYKKVQKKGNDHERYSEEEVFVILLRKLSGQITNADDLVMLLDYGRSEFSDLPYSLMLDKFTGQLTLEQLDNYHYIVSDKMLTRLIKFTRPENSKEYVELFFIAFHSADHLATGMAVNKYEKSWKFSTYPDMVASMLVAATGNAKLQEALLSGYSAAEGRLSISPALLISMLHAVEGNDGLQKSLAQMLSHVRLDTFEIDSANLEMEFGKVIRYVGNRNLQEVIGEMYGIGLWKMPNI